MANILIVGFAKMEAERLRDRIDVLMNECGWGSDSATVIIDAQTKWCGNMYRAPYLVVQHSKEHMAELIGKALHSSLNLDTQIEVTHMYFASVAQQP